MDLNYFLEWLVGVTSVAGLVRLLRFRTVGRTGWIFTFAATIALLLLGLVFFPHQAGIVAGAFWAIFVLGPSLLTRVVQRRLFRQDYVSARRWALVLMCLHPADGMREYPELLQSFELARQGRLEDAEQLLMRYETYPGWVGQTASLSLKRLRGDWESLLERCAQVPENVIARSIDMLTMHLRSLGELGKLNEMVQAFSRYKKSLLRFPKNMRDLARLYVYAFAGRTEMVKRLFAESLALYPEDVRESWIGVAQLAAGEVEEGTRRLEALKTSGDGITREAMQQRLARPVPVAAQVLIPPSVTILDEDEKTYQQEARFESASGAARPVVTYALIAANLVTFAFEIVLGGSTNPRTLWRMGAMMPSLVMQGEWWRIFAAQFLHYGFIHLAMNMLALYVLGPFVERELGRTRYTLLYLLSGAGAMITILLLTLKGLLADDFVVGASGSILGLIGASAAILLYGWIREGAAIARRRLGSILLIIVLQAIFDLTTPQISFTAHMGGAVFGFLIGIAMIAPRKKPTTIS